MRHVSAVRVRAEIRRTAPQTRVEPYPRPVTAPDPALTTALDHLTLQVNPDNVMAVYKVFRDHAETLHRQLQELSNDTTIGLCGLDPVSRDAQVAFGAKVSQLLGIHWAHQRELEVAAEHVKQIALGYGHTEAEITAMMAARQR